MRASTPTTAAATRRRIGVTRSSARESRRVARKPDRPDRAVAPVAPAPANRSTQIAIWPSGQPDQGRAEQHQHVGLAVGGLAAAVGRDAGADDDEHAREDHQRGRAAGTGAGRDLDGQRFADGRPACRAGRSAGCRRRCRGRRTPRSTPAPARRHRATQPPAIRATSQPRPSPRAEPSTIVTSGSKRSTPPAGGRGCRGAGASPISSRRAGRQLATDAGDRDGTEQQERRHQPAARCPRPRRS